MILMVMCLQYIKMREESWQCWRDYGFEIKLYGLKVKMNPFENIETSL